MKLSIVMPIYNAEKYLEECIDSILPEMREDVELLLIDDGSTDSAYHIMRRYEKSNIRILHHKNRGVSYTRNRGIQEAQGKYVMFVDADDRMIQDWSQPVLEACARLDDVIYFSNGLSGKKINKENIFNSIFQVPDTESIKYMTSPWSRLYRLAFLQEHNILFRQDIMYGEDALFNLDVILQARRFSCVGKSIYQYRHYETSSSRRYSPKFFESSLAYITSAEKMLTGHVSDPEIERYIGNSFVYNVYLFLFFISNISDYSQRKAALKIFQGSQNVQFIPSIYIKNRLLCLRQMDLLVCETWHDEMRMVVYGDDWHLSKVSKKRNDMGNNIRGQTCLYC